MMWRSTIGTTLGIAIYRGFVAPGLVRYRAWRDGPREQVARRNWRGVYVPDLTLIRLRRLFRLGVVLLFVTTFAVLFTLPPPSS